MLRRAASTLVLAALACTDQPFVTDVPLRVVAVSPTGDSVGTAREAPVVITFSEPLVPWKVPESVTLESLGIPGGSGDLGPVDAAVTYSDAPAPTVTVTPRSKLAFSTTYKITVATTLRRARDSGRLPAEVSWTFRTADPPPLRVERIEPGDKSSGVARNATVRVTFSEPLNCATLPGNAWFLETFDQHPRAGEGGSLEVARQWDCKQADPTAADTLDGTVCQTTPSYCTVTLVPEDISFLFHYSSHVTLNLRGGSRADRPLESARASPLGGQLTTTVVSSWHTVDPAPLAVVAEIPGAAAGMVARDAGITLTFSEPVDCTTIGPGFVKVEETFDLHPRLGARAGTTADVPGSWSCPTTAPAERTPAICVTKPALCTVQFTPAAGFLYEWSSDVTLTLAGGQYPPDQAIVERTSVESARATTHAGQLPATVRIPFHIVDPPPVAALRFAPAEGGTGVARSPEITIAFSEPPDCASLNDRGILAVSATPDGHPRTAGAAAPVMGVWSCPATLPLDPYGCNPGGASDPCLATFTPAGGVLPFEWSTVVELALQGGSFDAGQRVVESTRATTLGGQLPTSVASTWRVVDPPALALIGASPAGGASGVDRSPAIELTFSEPPDCASLNDTSLVALTQTVDPHPRITAASGPIEGAWICPAPDAGAPYACAPGTRGDPCLVTFAPAGGVLPFEWSTLVAIELRGGAFDASRRVVESTRATSLGGQLPTDTALRWRVADAPPLALVRAAPGDGASGVSRSPTIQLTFSEPPECATLADTGIVAVTQALDPHPRIAGASGPVAGAWSSPAPLAAAPYACVPGDASDPCVVTFQPAGGVLPFEWSTGVSIALAGGDYPDGESIGAVAFVESRRATTRGGELPAPAAAAWRVADPPPLVLLAAEPGNGATGVPRSPTIRLTFSEPPECANLWAASSITLTPDPHPRIVATDWPDPGAWSCPAPQPASPYACLPGDASDPCVITFLPPGGVLPFEWSTGVSIDLAGGDYPDGQSVGVAWWSFVESRRATSRGGQLPAPASATWRVLDPPPLLLLAAEPENGATGVARSPTIRLTFSEPPDCAGLADASITPLTETLDAHPRLGGGSGAVSGAWSCPDPQPAAPYACLPGDASDPCVVTFQPAANVLPFEWSTTVALDLLGGDYPDGAPLAAASLLQSRRATTRGGELPVSASAAWRVVDPPPIALVGIAPAAGATGVSLRPTIQLFFSEPPECTSLQTLAVVDLLLDPHPRISGTSGLASGEWTCPAPAPAAPYACAPGDPSDPCVATFAPDLGVLPLEWSTTATVSLTGGPFDLAARVVESTRATTLGGQLPTDLAHTWRAADPPPLALVAASPGDGAAGVERSPVVKLTFSEPPVCATLSDALIVSATSTIDPHPRLAGKPSPHVLAGAWSCPGLSAGAPFACLPGDASDPCVATLTLAPAELPLDPSTMVQVSLAGGDYPDGLAPAAVSFVETGRATTRGGELPTSASVAFRIEDPLPQSVIGTSPGDGAQEVAVLPVPAITIDLAQPVACATVSAQTLTYTVTLADGSTGAYALDIGPCNDGDRTLSLVPTNPALPLPFSATFAVTLAGGAFGQGSPAVYPDDNLESNEATTRAGQLPADFTFQFRTEEPPPMLLRSSSPPGGAVGVASAAPIDLSFSESIDCASVGAATVQVNATFAAFEDTGKLTPPPASVACSFTCPLGADPTSVRCAHAAFADSSSVEVVLQGGVSAAASIRSTAATATGGWLKGPPLRFSFRAQDPAPLTVIATAPSGNPGINVAATTNVEVTFDRAVHCATALGRLTLSDSGTAIAGTVVCTDEISVGPAVNGAKVIFIPSAPLTVERTYRATVAAGVAAADATVVDGVVKGKIEQPASFEFIVAHQDLQILSTVPAGGGTLVPVGTFIAIRFNQDIDFASLKPCDPGGLSPPDCNLWINPGSVATKSLAVSLVPVGYDNTDFVATFDPSDASSASLLQPNTRYTVQVLGNIPGPTGANGVSRLPTSYTWSFLTTDNALILSVTPDIGATGVDVVAPLCVEFAGDVVLDSLTDGGVNQITASYLDAFGRTAQAPLDPITPYIFSDTRGFSNNLVCLKIIAAPEPCFPGQRRLLYGTTYTGRVSTLVSVGGLSLNSPFTWTFATRTPPQISSVGKLNAVINEPLTDGENEVPVNAAFVVRFAEVMDPATLTPANISVVPADGASIAVVPDDPVNPRMATVTLSSAMVHSAPHALELLGGSGGVTTKAGNYLGSDVRYRFTTSPVTTLAISPAGVDIDPVVIIPVNSSRDLFLPSVTVATLFATFNGAPMSAIIAQQARQPRSVSYIAVPTYTKGASGYVIQTTAGILDYRGNPTTPAVSPTYTAGNTSSLAGLNPPEATQANVLPAAGATTNGDQSFTFNLPATATVALKERMLGASYYDGGSDGTVSLEATGAGGGGCPAARTQLALRVFHVAGATTTTRDSVRIQVLGPPFMKSGCGYALKIRQAQTANLYDLAPSTAACNGVLGTSPTDVISSATCAAGSPSPGILYDGESVAPTLGGPGLQVQTLAGFVPASGALGVFGGTVVRATFNEPVDPASVGSSTFSLAGVAGPVAGSYAVSGAVATFTPSDDLDAGSSYTITLGNVLDLAGNPFLGSSPPAFTVEGLVPTFMTLSFDATVTREAPFGTLILTFSEPVQPATLTVNTAAARGSVSVENASGLLYGCATLDPTDPTRILWHPSAALAGTTTVTVNHALAGARLTDRAGTEVPTTARTYP